MKKKLFTAAFLFLSIAGYSQGLSLGIRAGINNGNLSTKISGIDQGKVHNGFTMGAFGRVSLLGLFVQPEINFSQRIGEFQKVGTGSYTNTVNTIDVNALVGLSLLGVIRVNAGPTMMTFLSTSQVADASMKDANYGKDYYNSSAFGFQVGAGFDLGQLCIDLRYDMNLTSLGKDKVNSALFLSNTNYTTGFGMVQVTLGYKFIKL